MTLSIFSSRFCLTVFGILGFTLSSQAAETPQASQLLWYNAPAKNWQEDCLPIGNGHLGCMIYGGVQHEHIQFNEDSLWIGDEQDTGAYQAFGDLKIQFAGQSDASAYRRELDIDKATHSISYQSGGVNYQRDYFASQPADVLVFRFTADKKGSYSGSISLSDMHKGKIKAEGNKLSCSGSPSGTIKMKGKANYPIRLDYEAQVQVIHVGGSLQAADGKISFKGCDSLLIFLSADTSYLNQRDKGWKQAHPHQKINDLLAKASKRAFDDLRREHIADYQSLYHRVSLNLGQSTENLRKMTTDKRLDAYRGAKLVLGKGMFGKRPLGLKGNADPDLEELIFQYARYLMISCSRPGSLPANLQGLWNESNNPPWRSDYHSDVNLQMNYWFVDAANLSECFTPLSEWLWSVVPVKREATKKKFGVRGWAHRSENGIFGGASYLWVPGDAAWVMQNIWDHYAFTQDKEYLETRAYPLLKNLCEYWEDSLIEWPDGKLVSPKSVSPEHGPEAEGNSYEQQLVYDLFTNYIEASNALGKDEAFRKKVESMRSRLLGPQIGKWGQLQEWAKDIDNPNDKHRHLSHLLAVHPCRQISPVTTPKLAEAARVSLNARGDGGTGWSKAWKISMWARLHDGNRAYKLLKEQIHGNFYRNLLSFHPPFQIDANFGYAAGVCEMLVQSQTGTIELLPALPDRWQTGSVAGLKARGGFVVDLSWENGKLISAKIHSQKGAACKVHYAGKHYELKIAKGQTQDFVPL
jgi:alpha-L-fucosidase 2